MESGLEGSLSKLWRSGQNASQSGSTSGTRSHRCNKGYVGRGHGALCRAPPWLTALSAVAFSVCTSYLAQKLTCWGKFTVTQGDFSGTLMTFSYLPFSCEPIHVIETCTEAEQTKRNGCFSHQVL